MKDKLTFSPQGPRQDARPGAVRVVGFPSVPRPGIAKAKGTALHESAFLAERGCFGRAVSPKHSVTVQHHA
jgi:hypothetical protein